MKNIFSFKKVTIVNKGSSLTVVNVFKHTIFLKHDPSLIVTILNFICCKLFFVLFLWIHSLLMTKDYRPWSYNKLALKLKFFFVIVDINIFFLFQLFFFLSPHLLSCLKAYSLYQISKLIGEDIYLKAFKRWLTVVPKTTAGSSMFPFQIKFFVLKDGQIFNNFYCCFLKLTCSVLCNMPKKNFDSRVHFLQ